jgi:hypothetical protein
MTQTAVEWLLEQLDVETVLTRRQLSDVINKAKEMFKEQIIQAAQYDPFLGDLPRTEGIHYFEKTFKK